MTNLKNALNKLTSRKGRIWLYSTGLAVIGLLVGYGALTNETASLWSALLAPLLGLAIANVPAEDTEDTED